jgi:peptide/nickel transport system permease protein
MSHSLSRAEALPTRLAPARRSELAAVLRALGRHRGATVGAVVVLALVVLAVLAPMLAPRDPLKQDLLRQFLPPSAEAPMGTDRYGRDILSRVMWGARVSLAVGVLAVGAAFVVGAWLGTLAGYVGGVVGGAIMRVMDILLAFPLLLLALAMMAMLGPGLTNVMIAAAVSSIPQFARLSYGSTLATRERDYVTSARVLGLTSGRIMWRYILPNILAPLVVMATLRVATVIVLEANLSFIGVGVDPSTPSWGSLVSEGQSALTRAPWVSLFPALVISLFVLGFNLFGDGLRDALDPNMRHRE